MVVGVCIQKSHHEPIAFGPYVLERKRESGMMHRKIQTGDQELFVARDGRNGETVLLRRLAVDHQATVEARQALLEAARAATAFHHPAVLPVREVRGETDAILIVQPFPNGVLLSDVVAEGGPIPSLEALRWMHRFADAMASAIKAGLTLSQISPDDFVVREPQEPGAERGLLSLCPPVPIGWWLEVDEPAFASPEQQAGQTCDVRSALYSAGAVLCFMITGRHPDAGEPWETLIHKAALPPGVKNVLTVVLQADPARRCALPETWMEHMDRALNQQTQPSSMVEVTPVPAPPETAKTVVQIEEPKRHRRPFPMVGRWRMALAAVVLLSGAAWLIMLQIGRDPAFDESRKEVPTAPPVPTTQDPATASPTTLPPPSASRSSVPFLSDPDAVSDVVGKSRVEEPAPAAPKPDITLSAEDSLLAQARAAQGPARAGLYRKVLKAAPENREALPRDGGDDAH